MVVTIIEIILALIQAAPAIEKLIEQIIAALKHRPLSAAMEFENLILAHKDVADPAAAEAAFRAFHARVTAKP